MIELQKDQAKREVVVTDVQMPFGSMVIFMVKWAIASIPAMIILFIMGAAIMTTLTVIFGTWGLLKN